MSGHNKSRVYLGLSPAMTVNLAKHNILVLLIKKHANRHSYFMIKLINNIIQIYSKLLSI